MTQEVDLTICDIIQGFMGLADNQVTVYDENYEPPKTKGIYIVVMNGNPTVLANNSRYDGSTGTEYLETVINQEFKINVTSRDRTAIERKEEVLQALVSRLAYDTMESEGIAIWRSPQILDLSFIEGGSALKRFQVTCRAQYMKVKSSSQPGIDTINVSEVIES